MMQLLPTDERCVHCGSPIRYIDDLDRWTHTDSMAARDHVPEPAAESEPPAFEGPQAAILALIRADSDRVPWSLSLLDRAGIEAGTRFPDDSLDHAEPLREAFMSGVVWALAEADRTA